MRNQAHLARRDAKVVKMARRGEYEVKTWQGFSQNYSPRTAPSVRAAMHKRSQKLRSALPLDSAPPILWRTRFRYSTDLATLFDLKFPAHLAAACIHWFNMPTCKGIFSLPDASRRIRKHSQPLVPLAETTNRWERSARRFRILTRCA
jgi:hypothetical protein